MLPSVKELRDLGLTDSQVVDVLEVCQRNEDEQRAVKAEYMRNYRANVRLRKSRKITPEVSYSKSSSSSLNLPSEQVTKNNTLVAFERAWSLWPKRKGDNAKGRARKAWSAAIKRVEPERLIAAIKAYASSGAECIGTEYQPMLSTWLNGESYESFLPRESVKRDKDWMLKLNRECEERGNAPAQEATIRPDTPMGQNGSGHTAQLRPESGMDYGPNGRADPIHPTSPSDRRG